MDEKTFLTLSENMLSRLEAVVEKSAELAGVDLDVDIQSDNVLQITFENNSQIVVNRNVVAGEIWVAGRAGGFHFRPNNGEWIAMRDGALLWDVLERLISQQAGCYVSLTR